MCLYSVGRWDSGEGSERMFWKWFGAWQHWVPWVTEEGDKVEKFLVVGVATRNEKRGCQRRL